MNKETKKEPNRNINQLIAANDLDTTKRLLETYLSEKSMIKMNKQSVLKFFNKWVHKRNKSKTIRPYRLRNMLYQLCKIIKYYLIDHRLVPVIKQALKKEANKLARTLFTNRIFAPAKANTFSLKEIAEIINYLWNFSIPEKQTAIMLTFTFLAGNRVGDLFYSDWSDIKIEENDSGRYLSIKLKISKTNPLSLKCESITVKLKKGTIWDIEAKLLHLKQLYINNNLKSDRIFNNRSTKSFCYYMEKARKACNFKNKLSGHSGRNSVVDRMLRAGINADNICVALNWQRGSEMLYNYRNNLIEKSIQGAQFELDKYDKSFSF
jgi:hypothetical protein